MQNMTKQIYGTNGVPHNIPTNVIKTIPKYITTLPTTKRQAIFQIVKEIENDLQHSTLNIDSHDLYLSPSIQTRLRSLFFRLWFLKNKSISCQDIGKSYHSQGEAKEFSDNHNRRTHNDSIDLKAKAWELEFFYHLSNYQIDSELFDDFSEDGNKAFFFPESKNAPLFLLHNKPVVCDSSVHDSEAVSDYFGSDIGGNSHHSLPPFAPALSPRQVHPAALTLTDYIDPSSRTPNLPENTVGTSSTTMTNKTLLLSNPIPRRTSIFTSITTYFTTKSVSPAIQVASKQSPQPSPHPHGAGSTPRITPESMKHSSPDTHEYNLFLQLQDKRMKEFYGDMYPDPDHFVQRNTASPYLGENPSQHSLHLDPNNPNSLHQKSNLNRDASTIEMLRNLHVSIPCFFTLPTPSNHHGIAEITESIQLYSWIMPYIVACLPFKPIHQHLSTLPELLSDVFAAEYSYGPDSEHNYNFELPSSNLAENSGSNMKDNSHSKVKPDIGTSYVTNSENIYRHRNQTSLGSPFSSAGGISLTSWINLGHFYISRDHSNNSWEYRNIFLCDNFLYESYSKTFKLIGFIPLSESVISFCSCYFPSNVQATFTALSSNKTAIIDDNTHGNLDNQHATNYNSILSLVPDSIASDSPSLTNRTNSPNLDLYRVNKAPGAGQGIRQNGFVSLRRAQSDANFNSLSRVATPPHYPNNSQCIKITCLEESRIDSLRQTFYIYPAVPPYLESYDTLSTNANVDLSAPSGSNSSNPSSNISINLKPSTNPQAQKQAPSLPPSASIQWRKVLYTIKTVLEHASVMTLEDKYVVRRGGNNDSDYTLLGRGRFSEVRMSVRKPVPDVKSILSQVDISRAVGDESLTGSYNILKEPAQSQCRTAAPLLQVPLMQPMRSTGYHDAPLSTNSFSGSQPQQLQSFSSRPTEDYAVFNPDNWVEQSFYVPLGTKISSFDRLNQLNQQYVFLDECSNEEAAMKLAEHPDSCALKLIAKEIFWSRVIMGKERSDSLVREVLSQAMVSQAAQRWKEYEISYNPICEIYGMFETLEGFAIDLEMMQHINLFDRLHNEGPFPEYCVQQIVSQLVDAVNLCNSVGVAHRDIKLSNITYPVPKSLRHLPKSTVLTEIGERELMKAHSVHASPHTSIHNSPLNDSYILHSLHSKTSIHSQTTVHSVSTNSISSAEKQNEKSKLDGTHSSNVGIVSECRSNKHSNTGDLDKMLKKIGFTLSREVSQDSLIFSQPSSFVANRSHHSRNSPDRDCFCDDNDLLNVYSTMRIKLADFGMAGFLCKDGLVRGRCGTPGYVAPDIFNAGMHEGYPINVDMFSIGAVAYTLLCGYEPFGGYGYSEDVDMIQANKLVLYEFHSPNWDHISLEAKDFISKAFQKKARDRVSPSQARIHPWLRDDSSIHATLDT